MEKNVYNVADKLYDYLRDRHVFFNKVGFPLIPKEGLLEDAPDEMIPFSHRNACKNPKKTVICSFANDEHLYRRLWKYEDDIDILQGYMGVTGFDLSPRLGWDIKLQRFNLLLNRMVDAFRVVKGIKLLPNFRIGDISTLSSLDAYPHGSCYAAGALGCSKGYIDIGKAYLKTKLLYAQPSKLLIYGKPKEEYIQVLDDEEVPYTIYEDFGRTSRKLRGDA